VGVISIIKQVEPDPGFMEKTDSGRFLIVFFVYKKGNQALILSARDMTDAERKRHEKK